VSATFLPDRLRPRAARRRPRRGLVLLAVLPVLVFLPPLWRVQAVEIDSCPGLPAAVTTSLEELVGRSPLTVDPQWVRDQLEVWPVVAAVDVQLELPATLRVSVTPAVAVGSLVVGRRWHAVTMEGAVAGSLDRPSAPVLDGFSQQPEELRRALSVVRRLEHATGGRVEKLRAVTPMDYELRLVMGEREFVVLLRPEGSAGEHYWCDRVIRGDWGRGWADLRRDDRIVIGGGE